MEIRRYVPSDAAQLFEMMRSEGEEWAEYYDTGNARYRAALGDSIVFVAVDSRENRICGYVRARDDHGFGVYIYDLLVAKPQRGRNLGRRLMARICAEFPRDTVYVMSDVDDYYLKQGFRREGSIFVVSK